MNWENICNIGGKHLGSKTRNPSIKLLVHTSENHYPLKQNSVTATEITNTTLIQSIKTQY